MFNRRASKKQPNPPGTSTRLAVAAAAAFLVAAFYFFFLASQTGINTWNDLDPAALHQAFGIAGAFTALGAAVLLVWWWRTDSVGSALWLGLAMGLIGVLSLAVAGQLGAAYGPDAAGGTLEALRIAVAAVTIGLVIQAVSTPRSHLGTGLYLALAFSAAAAGALVVAFVVVGASFAWISVLLWVIAAVITLAVGLARKAWLVGWFGVGVVALAAYDLAMWLGPEDPILALGGGVILETGLLMVILGTTAMVQGELAVRSSGLMEARAELVQLKDEAASRAHEAGSALAAIDHSVALLVRSPSSPRLEVLEQALVAEVAMLRRLVTPTASRKQLFLVSDSLIGAVAVERLYGVRIKVDVLRDLVANGDVSDTAEAVQCLLENARIHAPGSTVTVSASRFDDEVKISVSDDGPGVPAEIEDDIFTKGVTTSDGDGLGLAIAADLMARQGGSVELQLGRDHGACFTMTLPAASIDRLIDDVDQIGELRDDDAGTVAASLDLGLGASDVVKGDGDVSRS